MQSEVPATGLLASTNGTDHASKGQTGERGVCGDDEKRRKEEQQQDQGSRENLKDLVQALAW